MCNKTAYYGFFGDKICDAANSFFDYLFLLYILWKIFRGYANVTAYLLILLMATDQELFLQTFFESVCSVPSQLPPSYSLPLVTFDGGGGILWRCVFHGPDQPEKKPSRYSGTWPFRSDVGWACAGKGDF
jgi:hypothetical protein